MSKFLVRKCLQIISVVLLASCSKQETPKNPTKIYTADEYKKAAQACIRAGDLKCIEINWSHYVAMRPNDSAAHAYYAIVLNWSDKPEQAIVEAERAIDMGEGTYDLFAAYAASLDKVGRAKEAIDWSYKSLAVIPSLVDVRGSLAKILVQQNKQYEALALLTSYDNELTNNGHPVYFEGQRISIESKIDRLGSNSAAPAEGLRVTKLGAHFYAPVRFGTTHANAFMVDTGASLTTMKTEMLEQLKLPYRVISEQVPVHTADGRVVSARQVIFDSMNVGPFELHNVQVLVCPQCLSLLGQNALSKFDLKSSMNQGVEFLTFEPRL